MTASASRCSGACAEPMVSRQPRGPRASSRTMAPVRTSAPEAAARAGGRVPRPPCRVVNTAGRARRLARLAGSRLLVSRAAGWQQRGGRTRQRDVRAGRLGQARQRRLERQLLRPPGVHPAEQRVDEPVHDLPAEPGAHVAGHRHVAVPVGHGQFRLLAGPGQPVRREQPGLAQLPQIGGHAHELPGGQRMHRAAAPDPGRGGARRDSARHPGRPPGPAPVPSGLRASRASAPTSTRHPATSASDSLPPAAGIPPARRPGPARHAGRTPRPARRSRLR